MRFPLSSKSKGREKNGKVEVLNDSNHFIITPIPMRLFKIISYNHYRSGGARTVVYALVLVLVVSSRGRRHHGTYYDILRVLLRHALLLVVLANICPTHY